MVAPPSPELSSLSEIDYLEWVIANKQDPLQKLDPPTFYEPYELRVMTTHIRGIRCLGVRKLGESNWRLGRHMPRAVHTLLQLYPFDGMFFFFNPLAQTLDPIHTDLAALMDVLGQVGVEWSNRTPGDIELRGRFSVARELPRPLIPDAIVLKAQAALGAIIEQGCPMRVTHYGNSQLMTMGPTTKDLLNAARSLLGDVRIVVGKDSDYRLAVNLVPLEE